MIASPVYHSPRLYELTIRLMHSKDRYAKLAGLAGTRKVLELGCGTGQMSKYFNGNYLGIDLNKRFVNYGRRRGRNLQVADIHDFNKFDCEVILVCDLLHHLPHHKEFLRALITSGKEIIVSEPFKQFPSILDPLFAALDGDGINDLGKVKWFGKDMLMQEFREKNADEIIEMKNNIIAVFNKKK
ncbi:Trans-aconitate 2-methyltransferase [Candidatus Gugararchaeum adminiculabundum]|nr:Trans-aconitate 2-methyltransferase [Candidatus Gugararchaeum adminiculabundum]